MAGNLGSLRSKRGLCEAVICFDESTAKCANELGRIKFHGRAEGVHH